MHAYIYAHSQISIDEYPGYWVQAISRLKSQYGNMTFADQIRYNRLCCQVIHKGGYSAIDYIKIFHNAKALEISVGNGYSGDQLMHTFLDSSHQDRKQSAKL